MLHAKFQKHQTSGSEKKVFFYGCSHRLSHVTITIYINFRSPHGKMALIGQAGFQKKIFEKGGRRADGRRRPEARGCIIL